MRTPILVSVAFNRDKMDLPLFTHDATDVWNSAQAGDLARVTLYAPRHFKLHQEGLRFLTTLICAFERAILQAKRDRFSHQFCIFF
jgi:hypothetical protein